MTANDGLITVGPGDHERDRVNTASNGRKRGGGGVSGVGDGCPAERREVECLKGTEMSSLPTSTDVYRCLCDRPSEQPTALCTPVFSYTLHLDLEFVMPPARGEGPMEAREWVKAVGVVEAGLCEARCLWTSGHLYKKSDYLSIQL